MTGVLATMHTLAAVYDVGRQLLWKHAYWTRLKGGRVFHMLSLLDIDRTQCGLNVSAKARFVAFFEGGPYGGGLGQPVTREKMCRRCTE